MKKFLFLLVLMSVLTAGVASPARAASGGCAVNIAATSGAVPFETTIEVTGPQGSTLVTFGDGSPDMLGVLQKHTYYAVSRYTITAIVNGNDGNFYRCHGYVNVTAGLSPTVTAVPPVVVPTTTPAPAVPTGPSTTSASGSINGDNNVAPVINGDNNKIDIRIEQPAPAVLQPAPVPAPALSFWQKFWLPWKTAWRGIVTIIEGWFDLNVP